MNYKIICLTIKHITSIISSFALAINKNFPPLTPEKNYIVDEKMFFGTFKIDTFK